MRTYKTKFWKDYLWLMAVPFLLGLGMYLGGLALLIYEFVVFWQKTAAQNYFGFVAVAFALIFLGSGQACIWVLWAHLKGTVSFGEESVVYRYPRFLFFLSYKEEKVPYGDIRGMLLGRYAMKKAYPEQADKVPGRFYKLYLNSGIKIYYEKNGQERSFGPPVIHDQDYFMEFKNIVEKTGLQPTEALFLFVKRQPSPMPGKM